MYLVTKNIVWGQMFITWTKRIVAIQPASCRINYTEINESFLVSRTSPMFYINAWWEIFFPWNRTYWSVKRTDILCCHKHVNISFTNVPQKIWIKTIQGKNLAQSQITVFYIIIILWQGSIYWKIPPPGGGNFSWCHLGEENMKRWKEKGGKCKRKRKKGWRKRKKGERKWEKGK